MEETRWVQLVSWHILKDTWVDPDSGPICKTFCGLERMWDGTSAETFPSDEKSCETCLRMALKEER